MYLSILLISLLLVVTNFVTYSVTKEMEQTKYRNKVKAEKAYKWKVYENGEEGLSVEEVAAKRINESLPVDNVKTHKEFKLATLVVEHESGRQTVEDHHLIDEDGQVFELSAFRKDNRNVDWMLNSFKVLESITANVKHEIVENIARFSAFDETLNNCYGGRHGKDKISVKDAFIVFTDLSRYQLDIIANHTDEDIHNKQFNAYNATLKCNR